MALPEDALDMLHDILKHRNWDLREGQEIMTDEIYDHVAHISPKKNVDVAINAPVGTGKTLAYLVAGLSGKKKIIVSVSTKSLQDQIINEELPRLAQDLKELYDHDITFSVLKGKSNYACMTLTKHLAGEISDYDEDLFGDVSFAMEMSQQATMKALADQLKDAMKDGDIDKYSSEAELNALPGQVRYQVRASRKCATRTAPWRPKTDESGEELLERVSLGAGGCVYRAAYSHAMLADIVVINSSLLVHEVIKANNSTESDQPTPVLLRGREMVIVDEAHHLPRILVQTFSREVQFSELVEVAEEVSTRISRSNDDSKVERLVGVPHIITTVSENLYEQLHNENEDEHRSLIGKSLRSLANSVNEAIDMTRNALGSKGLDIHTASSLQMMKEEVVDILSEAANQVLLFNSEGEALTHVVSNHSESDSEDFKIFVSPMDVSFFRDMLSDAVKGTNSFTEADATRSVMVMCSGTMTSEIPSSVGMSTNSYLSVPSPFDPRKARVRVASGLPEPKSREWFSEAWREALPAIKATNGRTLILTTSTARMEDFTEAARRDLRYKVLSQSDNKSKMDLINEFKDDESSVLVGTTSFWEGVDVPGKALSLVVIDKIPFPNPGDPIFESRRKWIENHGGQPFVQVDIDHASIMLAQGAGRLIRSYEDMGGVLILDSRLVTKRYGKSIMRLLPGGWPMTEDSEEFILWMRWIGSARKGTPPKPHPELWRPVRPKVRTRSLG